MYPKAVTGFIGVMCMKEWRWDSREVKVEVRKVMLFMRMHICEEVWGPCGEVWGPCGEVWGPCGEVWGPRGEVWGPCGEMRGSCGEVHDPSPSLCPPLS